MQQIITVLSGNYDKAIIAVIIILSVFIDISPTIKWNPIKSLLGYIGNCFNKGVQREISGFKDEVNTKLEALQQEQNAQRETLDKMIIDTENREMSKLRWEVIEFENSILNGQKHSREQYRHIIDCARKFERVATSSNTISVLPEDLANVKEACASIEDHYNKNRHNQSLLYF